jgi:hypothetical protein
MNLAKCLAVIAVVLGATGLGYFFLRGTDRVAPSSSSSGVEANPLPSLSQGKSPTPPAGNISGGQSTPKVGRERNRRPIESMLTTPEGLSSNLANIASDAKKFDDVLQKIEHQYYSDIEARKLTNAYSQQITSRFSDAGAGVSLQKIACGVLVCAGRFGGKQVSEGDFAELLMSSRGGEQGLYSAVIQIEPASLPGSPDATYRAFFSSDPQANGIIVKP